MSTQVLNYLDAIAHLPAGDTLILTDVPWEQYEQLLADLGDNAGRRITYDNGRLEVMSPSSRHENLTQLISTLALIVAEETNIVFENLGSTTYKQELLSRGVGPDACFYIDNAAAIIGREKIDLRIDPPPDIVVEIDVSHESASKLPIYAGMRVPEVWQYDGRRVRFFRLTGQDYSEVNASRILPVLTNVLVGRFLELGETAGQTAVRRSFREWLRAQAA